MYNRVLVPLDGSDLAETALPHLKEIASACKVPEIVLVSVTEGIQGKVSKAALPREMLASEGHVPPTRGALAVGSSFSGLVYVPDASATATAPATLGRMGKTAFKYLAGVASRLQEDGLKAGVAVLVGNPAEEILKFAREQNVDLIIMASRGKSGFSRWDMGNIADKVVRASESPVLLVKPKAGFKETKPRRRGQAT